MKNKNANPKLNIIPPNQFIQCIDKFVTTNDSKSISNYMNYEVYKRGYIEYIAEVKRNGGKFISDNDPIGITFSEKILNIMKDFMSRSSLEESNNYKVI